MFFTGIIAQIRDRLAKRAEFRRAIADINMISGEDLIDMRANRAEMIHQAYLKIYGDSAV